ncbi:hypothetical protein ACFLS9_10575, partial [Bacteroidota bacterium]
CFNNDLVTPEEPVIEKASEPNWLTLPESSEKSLEKTFSRTQAIFRFYGGTINLNKWYWDWSQGFVSVNASITFEPGFYDQNVYGGWYKYITLTVDDETCTSTFSPHMDFLKPATYNVTYSGIDLSGVNPDNIDFVYQAEDGSVQNLQYDRIEVDIQEGLLKVVNAKIPHFSRFGFVN